LLMREFVDLQRRKREHGTFLESKVELARASARASQGYGNDEVEADFAARRSRFAERA